MPQQIKGKSLSFVPKILAIHIEVVKIVPNKSDQKPNEEPPKQHFQVFIANPPQTQPDTTDNRKSEEI